MSDATRRVAVALPRPLPTPFDYRLDAAAATPPLRGCRLRVPLGSSEIIGVAMDEAGDDTGAAGDGATTLKSVLERIDATPILHGELWSSLLWLARYLHAPIGEVLASALPAALRQGAALPETQAFGWRLTEAGHTALPGLRAGAPRRFAELLATGERDEDGLDAQHPGWRTPARTLAKRGLIERVAMDAVSPSPATSPPDLNDEQRAAADAISAHAGFGVLLLDGVTGSGKTEVYLDAIARTLARGRQALVLVPEIGLTPQMLERFRSRLGVPIHALHSGLGESERARTWTAALRGQARVIVGTRSAAFVPLPEAGLIIVDEEHDGSYKQFDGIRYHARDFVIVRAKALGVPIVLGSATPSLETLHNAQAGRYTHLRLHHRAGAAQPPQVRVIDVRKRPLQSGLGPEALAAIEAALAAGGQVLVFRNRRGYAPVLLCHDCGWSAQCKRCDSPMTVHGGGRRLVCHHCGAQQPTPPACPQCASLALQPQGNGTERIEEFLSQRFTQVPVLRIDRGSTQTRDGLQQHLDTLGAQPGILIGTQMLAKGHDLPNLTLVVVVGIDEGLFSADFRSGEKLAQLLVQVAGRAGRADKPGTVLLQTHHPDHPLLQTLVTRGYHAFAEEELAEREAAIFPPFAHMALLRAEAKDVEPVLQFLRAAKARVGDVGVEVHGPLAAPMPRRAGYQRMQLILSSPSRAALQARLDAWVPELYRLPEARRVRWSLDVDPVDLY
ncbi:primosomal protein N' [Solilutibacter silvestris]|uniref:Replication restart protein PriA n=1 Tax=Solilutibacter silvestris TaxID=1645665 RepID=A0A2K1Q0I4_9GAMM|nr:primosomal protein N' [Lysobacter silvestris]PNS08546.1 priA: primosomal protein N' [Lysobacter silvestris]